MATDNDSISIYALRNAALLVAHYAKVVQALPAPGEVPAPAPTVITEAALLLKESRLLGIPQGGVPPGGIPALGPRVVNRGNG